MHVGGHEVSVTNPDKIFFPEPGLTKGDLVQYYVDLADAALPHLRHRLFHMVRYPNGVDGKFFHQKRVPPHPEFVGEQIVEFPSGHSTVFAVIDNTAALAWVVNLGCIELHTWHSRIDDIERPDYLLIDLDPTTDGQWPYVRRIALVVREVMDELGFASYPKTSGATGLHVMAPIRPELLFPEVRRFAKALAEEVERRVGDQDVATTTWKVADRRGVFVDFGQNTRDRTIATAYSVRPTVGRPRVGAAALGRGRGRRPRRLHGRDDPRPRRRRRRSDCGHVGAGGFARAALREARPRVALTREQALEGRVVLAARRPHLTPRALVGILVVAEADEARAVAEAVALHLVVAHLGDELRADGRLLQLAAPPAVGLGETTVGCVLQQGLDAVEDLLVLARGDGRGADVVDLPAFARTARAAASRSASGFSFQRTPTITQSAVLNGFTFSTPSREPGRYGSPSFLAITPSRPAASKLSSHF